MHLKRWTKEEEQVLKENAYLPMRELVEMLPGRNRKTIYWKLSVMGINRQTYKRYDKDEDAYIIANYQTKGNREIAKKLKRTENAIAKRMIVLGIKRTNDDLKYLAKSNTGCFKKGDKSCLSYLEGTLHLAYDSKYNYYFYRIKHNGQMMRFSRYLYEIFHGISLGENDVIRHKDGNPLNVKIDNLELINRSENLDQNINNDDAFIKRIFRVKDKNIIASIKENAPELIELKRKQIKLNQLIKKSCKNN